MYIFTPLLCACKISFVPLVLSHRLYYRALTDADRQTGNVFPANF